MYKEIVDYIKNIFCSDIVPLHTPVFIGNEKKYLGQCIDSTYVSYIGEFVTKFEDSIKQFTGAKNAIATLNGTCALHIALHVSGVQSEDEIITTSLTFVATANAITYTGAKVIFVDNSKETLGLSADKLGEFLSKNTEIKNDGHTYNKTTGRRIFACVPVHTYGHPVEIEQIINICDKYNIIIVEDSAESLGSFYKGKHTGTFGKLGILSFNGNKIITTGGGGMIITDDDILAIRIKHITTTAKIPHQYEFYHDELGYNYRMPNINASIGLAQMQNLQFFLQNKKQLAFLYNDFFNKYRIEFFTEKENCLFNCWLNTIIMNNKIERDEFLQYSNNNGVETRPAWTLMNKLPMYKNCFSSDITNATWLADRIVNLPSSVRI